MKAVQPFGIAWNTVAPGLVNLKSKYQHPPSGRTKPCLSQRHLRPMYLVLLTVVPCDSPEMTLISTPSLGMTLSILQSAQLCPGREARGAHSFPLFS
jgi:hypothetical protein